MDLKEINKILGNLNNIQLRKVSDVQPRDYWNEKYDGGTSTREVIYDLADGSGLFLKTTYMSDSYGNTESIAGVQFVEPKEKLVTVYE